MTQDIPEQDQQEEEDLARGVEYFWIVDQDTLARLRQVRHMQKVRAYSQDEITALLQARLGPSKISYIRPQWFVPQKWMPDEEIIMSAWSVAEGETRQLRGNEPITHEDWLGWKNDPKRQYHCVTCKDHGSFRHFLCEIKPARVIYKVVGCETCRGYKAIEPCIPGKCILT